MSDNLKQKTYILENLGCANCAAKMERKIQELPEIESASIVFATKQLRIAAEDPYALEDEIQHICSSIESEVKVIEYNDSLVPHHQKNGFFREHKIDVITLVVGGVLFAFGAILTHIWGYDMWFAGGGRLVILTFLLFATAYLLLGGKVLLAAARNILHGQVFDENFLMSIATIAAFSIGEFAEGAGVMLFYRIGQLFEDIAVERSRNQIMDAVDMRPETVMLVEEAHHDHHEHDCSCGCACEHDHEHHEHCGCEHHHDHHHEARIIPAEAAKPGDIILVRPGDRIPLDGVVIEGESRIDTSPVTGEPVPVRVHPGSDVVSGCMNEHGVLKIRVIRPLSESMVTKILDSVENAAAGKPKIDKFITRFARIYTPIVVCLAVLTAIIPSLITSDWGMWIKTAITFLVISCPCALVISVPLAFFSGIGSASKLGILFKGGLAIEALNNVKAIVMDKTGTITKGSFEVNSVSAFGDYCQSDVLSVAAACEKASNHPIAASILAAHHHHHEDCNCGHHHNHHDHDCNCGHHHNRYEYDIEEIAGMGVKAQLAEGTALCGNRKLMNEFGIELPDLVESTGTEVLVSLNGRLIGRIIISDQLKSYSISAISKLKSMGLVPAMLTGDNSESAEAVASKCGISEVHAGLLPTDKVNKLAMLREKLGAVMFVGDGINDAPVLAGADVGAAMGSGADTAIEVADVVFMTSSLESVPQSVKIARYTKRIAIQNIILALAVKLLVIILGLLGLANIWAAVFADTGVAMLCILNSLRVLWRKYS